MAAITAQPLSTTTNDYALPTEQHSSPTSSPSPRSKGLIRSLSYRDLHHRLDSSEASPSEHSSIFEALTSENGAGARDRDEAEEGELQLELHGLYGVNVAPLTEVENFQLPGAENEYPRPIEDDDLGLYDLSPSFSHSRWPEFPMETIAERRSYSTMHTLDAAEASLSRRPSSNHAQGRSSSFYTPQSYLDEMRQTALQGSRSVPLQRSKSLDDLQLSSTSLREAATVLHTPQSSGDTESGVEEAAPDSSFPKEPTHPPLDRPPTPPGIPSFGSQEALDLHGGTTRRPSAAQRSLTRLVSPDRGEDPDNEPGPVLRWLTNTSLLGARSYALPRGVVAQANDGTVVRGSFGARQSGHGVGASGRGLSNHPFAASVPVEFEKADNREVSGGRAAASSLRNTLPESMPVPESAVMLPFHSPERGGAGQRRLTSRQEPSSSVPSSANRTEDSFASFANHVRGIFKRTPKRRSALSTPVEFPDGSTYSSISTRKKQRRMRITNSLPLQTLHRESGARVRGSGQTARCSGEVSEGEQTLIANLVTAGQNMVVNRANLRLSLRGRRNAFAEVDALAGLEQRIPTSEASPSARARVEEAAVPADILRSPREPIAESEHKPWYKRAWRWLLIHLCDFDFTIPDLETLREKRRAKRRLARELEVQKLRQRMLANQRRRSSMQLNDPGWNSSRRGQAHSGFTGGGDAADDDEYRGRTATRELKGILKRPPKMISPMALSPPLAMHPSLRPLRSNEGDIDGDGLPSMDSGPGSSPVDGNSTSSIESGIDTETELVQEERQKRGRERGHVRKNTSFESARDWLDVDVHGGSDGGIDVDEGGSSTGGLEVWCALSSPINARMN